MFALDKMIDICVYFAARSYDIMYNKKKCKIIVFQSNRRVNNRPNIEINGKIIDIVETIVHLGNILSGNISKCDTFKCVLSFLGNKIFFTSF